MGDIRGLLIFEVARILPHLSEDEVGEIAEFLIGEGVRKEADLRHMTVPILKGKLTTVDASEIFDEWQKNYGALRPSTSQNTRNVEAGPSCPAGPSSAAVLDSLPEYDSDSPFIPSSVRTAIKAKKRASAKGQEEMVERMVDDYREKVPNLARGHFKTLANRLVARWPDTFADTVPVEESRSTALTKQFRVKFDNEKRNSGQGRRGRGPTAELASPAIPQAYGCLNWSPPLPADETEETQEDHRVRLQNISELSRRDCDWKMIRTHLEASFYLQRKEFNAPILDENKRNKGRKRKATGEQAEAHEEQNLDNPKPTAKTHTTRWPMLLRVRGMNIHFKQLTGKDFKQKLSEFIREEGKVLTEFLAVKGENLAKLKRRLMRYEARGSSSAVLTGLLLMLVMFFKEEEMGLFMLVEETTNFEEVMTILKTNNHDGAPLIVVAGKNMFDTTYLFVTIDNEALTSVPSMADAVVMLFEAHFVFNICYSSKAATVLTFIQRVIAEINPNTGYRCSTTALQKKANQKVVNLTNKYTEFKQKLDEEDKEN